MGQKLIIEKFESITEYLDALESRPVNSVFNVGDLESNIGSMSFCHSSSWDESVSLLRNGYKDGLIGLTSGENKFSRRYSGSKNIPTSGVVGYSPHVPNAISGVPNSMIFNRSIEQKVKVITILYLVSVSSGVDTKSMIEAGKKILNITLDLELQGYRVGIYTANGFCSKKEIGINMTRIKSHRHPINPQKIAYPLVHPSFFRRQAFRWIETNPNITDENLRTGYGKPLRSEIGNTDSIRKWMREKGILPQGWFFTDYYEAVNLSVVELVKRMGIN